MNLIDISQESDYLISKNGKIDEDLQLNFENTYAVKLICTDNCNPKYGDLLSYEIKKESKFIIIGFTTNEVILKKKLWGGHLWNPSYFIATVSENTEEQIRNYIKDQKEK